MLMSTKCFPSCTFSGKNFVYILSSMRVINYWYWVMPHSGTRRILALCSGGTLFELRSPPQLSCLSSFYQYFHAIWS
jgi:hypothetical protein